MKKTFAFFFLLLALVSASVTTKAQAENSAVKYRRSALHLILLESDDFPKKETVMKAYTNSPFPEKYDNHTIGFNSFNPKNYTVSDEERKAQGATKSLLGNLGAAALSSAASTTIENDGADIPIIIDKFMKDKKIANQLIAKWFNRKPDGSFDMKLVGERGSYNATEMEANIAKGTIRGTAALADAGEELIKNTFVVFTRLKYVSNEPIAAAIRLVGQAKANKLPVFLQDAAYKALDVVYNKTKEGYSVWTTSYLYQLKWNDSIAAVYYDKYWMDKTNVDAKRKAAFDNAKEFEMQYLGSEKSSTLVTFSLKSKRTEEQIIELATVRNIDAVYAKLQKEYDVFKPKTPLYSGNPITAKIGMKEGLEGGEKFEVLEQTIDEKTGLTVYVKKGIVTVDKKSIWDNRYNAGEGDEKSEEKDDSSKALDRTTFKGGSKYFAGMLIRQIK